jgi:hypothetical protein
MGFRDSCRQNDRPEMGVKMRGDLGSIALNHPVHDHSPTFSRPSSFIGLRSHNHVGSKDAGVMQQGKLVGFF